MLSMSSLTYSFNGGSLNVLQRSGSVMNASSKKMCARRDRNKKVLTKLGQLHQYFDIAPSFMAKLH